jgi:PelA/Pel-15E family pectate lyase
MNTGLKAAWVATVFWAGSLAVWGASEPAEITAARIAALPAEQRTAWQKYFDLSQQQAKADRVMVDAEVKELGLKKFTKARNASSLKLSLTKPATWYGGDEAKKLAEIMLSYQTPGGGWSKHVAYDAVRQKGESYASDDGWRYIATFDNGATITQLRFLGKVYQGTGEEIHRAAILRGLEYILAAQYPNGGWPQVFPLMGGYHDAITYNDDAMMNILRLLRDVAAGKGEFGFVPAAVRERAKASVARGLECILKTQVVVAGRRTAWGQQHDALTLKPTTARAYEMISLAAGESAGTTRFLMELESPSPAVTEAVQAAVAWFKKTAIQGQEWKDAGNGRQLVPAAGAAPIWSRYYEIGTDKPLFGDRDRTIHYDILEISKERRNGYAWFGNWGVATIKEYEGWNKKW